MSREQSFLVVGAAMMVGLLGAVPSGSVHAGRGDAGRVGGRIVFEAADDGVNASDAVIYLVGDGLTGEASAGTAVLNQEDLEFIPHVLPVVVGTDVKIHNSDAIMHNVHTVSRANRPFNKSQLAGMELSVTFGAAEVVMVTCDVHSQMSAYILVLPNSYFARARSDGSFTIEGVPAGKYELVGWHEKYGKVTSEIEVVEGKAAQAIVKFPATA